MTDPTGPDWADIRRRYEDTADAVADICRDAGISQSDIDKARKKEKWRRRNPRPFPPPRAASGKVLPSLPVGNAAAGTSASPPWGGDRDGEPMLASSREGRGEEALAMSEGSAPPSTPVPSPAARRRLLERLVAAISMKLEQLERRISHDLASGEDSSATDHDRETRAIGFLIDNLDKLRELEAGYAKPAGQSGPASAATDLADEAERCRRELAERFSRLVEAAGKDT